MFDLFMRVREILGGCAVCSNAHLRGSAGGVVAPEAIVQGLVLLLVLADRTLFEPGAVLALDAPFLHPMAPGGVTAW